MWCVATYFYWTPMRWTKLNSDAETSTIHTTHTLMLGFHSNQKQHLAEDGMTEIASHVLLIAHFSLSSLQCLSCSTRPISRVRGLCGNSFPQVHLPINTWLISRWNLVCNIRICGLKVKRAAVNLNKWTSKLYVMYYKDVCCGASQVILSEGNKRLLSSHL